MLPYSINAANDLDVYPLDGLLAANDYEYAATAAGFLAKAYTGFSDEQISNF